MALINCPECNNKVSDKASNCPRCGFPLSEVVSAPNDSTILIPENKVSNFEVLCLKCGEKTNEYTDVCPRCGANLSLFGSSSNNNLQLKFHPGYKEGSDLCPYCNSKKGTIRRDGMMFCFDCNKAIVDGNKISSKTHNSINNSTSTVNSSKKKMHPVLIVILAITGFFVFIHAVMFLNNLFDDFDAHAQLYLTDNNYGVIWGKAKGNNAKVIVNGNIAQIKDGSYSIKVPLRMGDNNFIVKYTDDKNSYETPIVITRVTTKDLNDLKTPQSNTDLDYNNALSSISGVNRVTQIAPSVHLILHNRNYSWDQINNIISNVININSNYGNHRNIYIIDYSGYVVAKASFRAFNGDYLTEYYYNPADRPRFYE